MKVRMKMVAIKDMEMPRWCGECGMCKEETIDDETITYCILLNQDITWNGNRDENCPLVEIEERKVGKWIRKPIRNDKGGCIGAEMICSCCNKDNRHDEYMDYCPNCGAEMRDTDNG